MTRWLFPTLGYIFALGALGVTGKLAVRTLPWQTIVVVTTAGYLIASAALAGLGSVRFEWNIDLFWAAVSAAMAIASLIFLYLALGTGEASKVVPVSAAYPAVTLVLAAVFLSEALTPGRIAGLLLVVGGVVVLTSVK